MLTSREIRQTFLDFFKSKQHLIVSSSPIVAHDDPTLMFTNAGMNQFKDMFLGFKPATAPRIADTQKCLRVSGKHNDLEDVGHDTYHHTMFEMLGNWSFGDYYKKEAISWAWELLTEVYRIPKENIYVTVFGGDEKMGLPADIEAEDIWGQYTTRDRILRFSKKDNFWEMGETGPCGPCTEIHVDLRSDADKQAVPGRELVNRDHPEVIEIWNNVFMEFNRKEDLSLEPLPAKNVDTGMGFERLCMVLQGVRSNYDTDVFLPFRNYMEQHLGCKYGRDEKETIAMRVVMDHIRAITFAVADGLLMSNTGAGYYIRRILRRASRYGFTYLNQSQPFLFKLVEVMAEQYKGVFDEVTAQKDFIARAVEEEEKSFLRTLERGIHKFEEYVTTYAGGDKQIAGDFAFMLYDTYGFPIDLTSLMAREKGWKVDMDGYNENMKVQSERSRAAGEIKVGDWTTVAEMTAMPVFVGYDNLTASCSILQHRTVKTRKGDAFQLVTDVTPFYAESGGEVGDTGTFSNGKETLNVLDTKRENELIVHFVDKLPSDSSGTWTAQVDANRRRLIRANHSATHLLHAALRQVLGTHVEQKGSLVTDESLRFDFSHFGKMTDEEIAKVESIVNRKIAEGIALDERRNVPIAEAKGLGAMALFGEKYGDAVRVIIFDPQYSIELCGGCHVANTSDIRLFKIVSEGSIAAGIRRVEAVTSDGAVAFLNGKLAQLAELQTVLNHPKDATKAVQGLLEQVESLNRQIEKLNREKAGAVLDTIKDRVRNHNGVLLLNEVVEVPTSDDLKNLAYDLRRLHSHALIVLGAVIDGKPQVSVILGEELEKAKTHNASDLVRKLATEIQGGGGGQPFFASAGGKKPEGIAAAVKKIEELV
jgi:alanyl-tRNA synthetase